MSFCSPLLFQDGGARQRCRLRVQMQVLSDSGIEPASGRKSAQQAQPAREPAGGVSGFWANRARSLKDYFGNDVRVIRRGHYLLQRFGHARTNLAVLIEL